MIVRKLRIEKGLSQEQLAHMAGISTRTLQRIERGANASPETLKCIASALDTDFGNLRKDQDMPSGTHGILPQLSQKEQKAMEYVRDIRSFYMHLIQYAVMISALAVLNLFTSPGYLWFLWVAAGWGIGVVGHGLSVFEIFNPFGDDWEKRQIEKRMGRRH
ncbi:helix-turn-helix domain-containing protein [Pseudovibrio sp. SCP19]|uniref:helix-turn-helix domain-containing protein n=1 Tax=Pseudovibrio sp. SCP19 TaxID=3141374 RepID=UPI00333A967E